MKKAISEIKWVAAINGDDQFENDVIRIGIQKFEDDYNDKIFFDLVADNGDDISQGGFTTEEKAIEAIFKLWGQWETFEAIDAE